MDSFNLWITRYYNILLAVIIQLCTRKYQILQHVGRYYINTYIENPISRSDTTFLNVRHIPFQFDQFESMEDCTCVNHEFIFSGSGQKSFRMYNLHTLISSSKILPVLSQKICDVVLPRLLRVTKSHFGPHSLLLIPPSPNNYQTYLDPEYPQQLLKTILVSRTSASRWGDRYRWGEGRINNNDDLRNCRE